MNRIVSSTKVTLDFGPVFNGAARWLEIAVRDATVVPPTAFTTLAPRQLITPAPYATYAPFAGTAAVANSLAAGVVFNTNLAAGAVTFQAIANGAVTTEKIANGNITVADIAPGQVVQGINGLRDQVVLQAGANITLFTSGNMLQITGAGGAGATGWSLTGNSGTAPGANFVGTTDNQTLELKVNGSRALRLEPNATSPNLIGGYGARIPFLAM